MKEKKVFTVNELGEKLVGIETLPDNVTGKLPTVVLVHGFGVDKREKGMFDALAEKLAASEVASYRFDFSGRGESEGNYEKTTLTKLKLDLGKILEFVQCRPNVDISRIGVFAQSFGTSVTVALMPKVKAIALMGSIAHPREILGIPYKWVEFNECGISRKIKPDGEVITIGPRFWKDFDNYNLLESICKIHCPILFIHGSRDERVPLSEMEAYFENANKPKEKVIIEGAMHSMELKREKMYEFVTKWLKRQLGRQA